MVNGHYCPLCLHTTLCLCISDNLNCRGLKLMQVKLLSIVEKLRSGRGKIKTDDSYFISCKKYTVSVVVMTKANSSFNAICSTLIAQFSNSSTKQTQRCSSNSKLWSVAFRASCAMAISIIMASTLLSG